MVEDIGVDVVKIGMLYNVEVVCIVVDVICCYCFVYVVFDLVMVVISGDCFVVEDMMVVFVCELFLLVIFVIFNFDEVGWLLGCGWVDVVLLEFVVYDL